MIRTDTNSSQLEMSCRESGLLLRTIDLDKPYQELTKEQKLAVRHYADYGCTQCIRTGLDKIIQREMGCQEALETWANNPGPLYLAANTLKEIQAVEHIWGKKMPRETGGGFNTNIDQCQGGLCQSLFSYWSGAHLSSHYDGEQHIADQIPFTIINFLTAHLPIRNLLKIQERRIKNLLSSIRENRIIEGYHSINDALYELASNIASLEGLARGKYK